MASAVPTPASIRSARRSSSAASASVGGHIGLKLYHCSGAAAIVASSADATAWVARAMSASDAERTSMSAENDTWNIPSAPRRIATGRMSDLVFAASVAGPAGSVVHDPNITGHTDLLEPPTRSAKLA